MNAEICQRCRRVACYTLRNGLCSVCRKGARRRGFSARNFAISRIKPRGARLA